MLSACLVASLPSTKMLTTGFRSRGSIRLFSDATNYLTPLAATGEEVYVVSGSSRGIGLEFSRQLLLRTVGTKVIGLSRTSSDGLVELKAQFPDRMHIVHVDLEEQESVEAAGKAVAALASRVDILLNVAGILGDGGKNFPGPERSILTIDRDWFTKTLNLNLIGHVMMTKALVPLLKKDKTAPVPSKIVNLSARVGSIADNSLGGWYSYRISKSGLNMFTKTSSIELKRYRIKNNDRYFRSFEDEFVSSKILFFSTSYLLLLFRFNSVMISIHPGTTDTDLSVPFQKGVKPDKLFSVEKSVGLMLNVVWNANLAETGKFFAFDGVEIPW